MAEERWRLNLFFTLAVVVPARTPALSIRNHLRLISGAPLSTAAALTIAGVQDRCNAALANVLVLNRAPVPVSSNGGARGTRT